MHRQSVEELIGHQQQGPPGNLGEARMPLRAVGRGHMGGQGLVLALPEIGARLHEMETQRSAEGGADPRRPQRISHKRAAAGPQLDEVAGVGAAHFMPDLDAPEPDELAEHLAHLRGGDEIAGATQGIAALVIAVERMAEGLRHELGDGDGPGQCDAAQQQPGQRRHGARRARQMKAMPKAIMGSDRIWPMVVPPMR